MYLKVQGLVLRVTNYKDHDALLTVLTRSEGKITVKARGLRRKNSPLTGPCQLLSYSEFTLFEYRGMYTINEATSIELFYGLRRDLVILSLATYFAQVADAVSQEDTQDGALLSLTLNSLYALDNLNLSNDFVKGVFEFRCACISGYMPDLSGCYRCGEALPDRFNVTEGHLECQQCKDYDSGGLRLPISGGVLDAVRYINSCSDKRLFSFRIGEDTAAALSALSETYLSTQLEQGFSTLDFYKSLQLQQ